MAEEQYLVMEDPRDLARVAYAFSRFTHFDLYVEVDPDRGLTFYAGLWDERYPPHVLVCFFPKERFLEWRFTERFTGASNTMAFWRGTRRIKKIYAVIEPAGPFLSFYDVPAPGQRRLVGSFAEAREVKPPKIPTPRIVFRGIRWEILDRVMDEVVAAGLDWLAFVGKPPEKLKIFGRDEIFYEAELPVDTVVSVERDYVVAVEEKFRDMRAFLEALTKRDSVDIGKVEDKTFYMWSRLFTGAELTLYWDDTWIKSEVESPSLYYAYTTAIEAAKKELEIPYTPTPIPEVLPSPLIRVRFKYPWPPILVDKTMLGPFKRGDIVTAPPEALKRALELGYAEKIEGSTSKLQSSSPELIISEEEVAFPSIRRLAEVGAY